MVVHLLSWSYCYTIVTKTFFAVANKVYLYVWFVKLACLSCLFPMICVVVIQRKTRQNTNLIVALLLFLDDLGRSSWWHMAKCNTMMSSHLIIWELKLYCSLALLLFIFDKGYPTLWILKIIFPPVLSRDYWVLSRRPCQILETVRRHLTEVL